MESEVNLSELVLARIWGAGISTKREPLAVLAMRRDDSLPVMVNGLLESMGWDDHHLWTVYQTQEPRGKRRIGVQYSFWPPKNALEYICPAELEFGLPLFRNASIILPAAETHIDTLAGEDDEAFLLYDYGDHDCFRIKFSALDTERKVSKEYRARLLAMAKSFSPGKAVILKSRTVQQYY